MTFSFWDGLEWQLTFVLEKSESREKDIRIDYHLGPELGSLSNLKLKQ